MFENEKFIFIKLQVVSKYNKIPFDNRINNISISKFLFNVLIIDNKINKLKFVVLSLHILFL